MSWGIVATIGGTIVSGLLNHNDKKNNAPQGSNNPAFYDPYSAYRPDAARKLDTLMSDPSQVSQSPEWKAMLEAAGRTSAAQGYNGSGNALVAAANAGGQAYQQEFNNLAMLSGAQANPANAAALAAQQGNYNQQYQQQMNQNMWGGLGSIFGRMAGGFGGGGGGDTSGYEDTWGIL